jgi:hypothetical protein
MPAPIYDVPGGAAVALAAATAKSVLGVKAHANSGLLVTRFSVAFDGVTASAVPVFIELCYSTFATNSPGTASTTVTPLQRSGRSLAVGFTAAKTWTTEPTVLTTLRSFDLTPNGGVLMYDYPLGTEPDCNLAEGFVIRVTAPAVVNVVAEMSVVRC